MATSSCNLPADFDTWLEEINAIKNFISNATTAIGFCGILDMSSARKKVCDVAITYTGTGGSRTISDTTSNARLNALKGEIQTILDCINSKITRVQSSTNTIFDGQYSIADLEKQIEIENKNIDIAKQRLESIRHPERHTSFYESWFPLDRPMNPVTIITLLTLIIFISVFLLLCLLSLTGINLTIISQTETIGSMNRYSFYNWVKSQFTFSFFVSLCVLAAVIIYFVKRS